MRKNRQAMAESVDSRGSRVDLALLAGSRGSVLVANRVALGQEVSQGDSPRADNRVALGQEVSRVVRSQASVIPGQRNTLSTSAWCCLMRPARRRRRWISGPAAAFPITGT